MNQKQQRKIDSLLRVRDFLDDNADHVGAIKDSEGRKQLDGAIAALTTHGDDQAATDLAMAGQSSRQRALAIELRASHMQPIAKFARAKLRGVPDFAALVKSGRDLQPKQLVRAARAMATAAAPQADVITRAGFPADTVAQLGTAATALDNAIIERANAKVRRVGSTTGIHEELVKGREAVAMLNAVVSKQFVSDKTFLAAWRAAHRVTAMPRSSRASAAVTPSAPAAVAPSPAAVAPPPTPHVQNEAAKPGEEAAA